MTLPDDIGAMSIDFLIGFTIFMLAFIWVATMIPGMLVGLHATNIDYDAVAYRTGVILAEDPGWKEIPAWENQLDQAKKTDIIRFGLAIRKDSPNILSQNKIDRFFNLSKPDNLTVGFTYPDDYQPRVIFGDYPYKFNITLRDIQREKVQSVGDILPEDAGTSDSRLIDYGYIRRLVKIKSTSNATINVSDTVKNSYLSTSNIKVPTPWNQTHNVTTHTFSILINTTRLLKDGIIRPNMPADASRAHDMAYIIDPTRDLTIINITGINSTLPPDYPATHKRLMNISMKRYDLSTGIMMTVGTVYDIDIDGVQKRSTTNIYNSGNGFLVTDNVSFVIQPDTFNEVAGGSKSPVYVNMTFELGNDGSSLEARSFLNNTWSKPFDYNFDPTNVTQPSLRDGILEVAVW